MLPLVAGVLAVPLLSGAGDAANASGTGAGAVLSRALQALDPTNTKHIPHDRLQCFTSTGSPGQASSSSTGVHLAMTSWERAARGSEQLECASGIWQ
jgi:hypothetical protein